MTKPASTSATRADRPPARPAPGGGRDLVGGPITATLLAFALPTLASNVLQSLNGAINSVWVGQLLGTTAVAATTNANLLTFMVFALSFGLSMAITVLIGQSAGRRDVARMREFVGAGVAMFGLSGIAIALVGWFALPAVLHLLRTPADVYPLALSYGRVVVLGLPASLMLAFLQSALRGMGDSMTPLLSIIPATLIDVLLNPVLIRGLGPAPRMGIAGSATAALIASYAVLLGLVGYVYARDLPIRLRGADLRWIVPTRATTLLIVRRGVPMGLQMVVVTVASLAMVNLINGYGTTTVAAYGAANQLWTYVQMPAFAIGAAVSAMAAQCIGADRWDRVDAIMASGVALNLAMTSALVVVFLLFDSTLLGWFLGNGPAAVAEARHINLLAGWSLVLSGVTMVVGAVPRANGATIGPLVIAVVALVPGRLGIAVLLSARLGADGVWWSFPSGYLLSLVFTAGYYRFGGWRRTTLLVPPSRVEAEDIVAGEGEPFGRTTTTA